MEAIGSSLFLIILLIGFALMFRKDNRALGLIIVLFAGFFLYVIPYMSYQSFVEDSQGTYRSDSGYKLTIYESETFSVYDIYDKAIDTGTVEYMNVDGGQMSLHGNKRWLERKNYWEICCAPDGTPFKR